MWPQGLISMSATWHPLFWGPGNLGVGPHCSRTRLLQGILAFAKRCRSNLLDVTLITFLTCSKILPFLPVTLIAKPKAPVNAGPAAIRARRLN